MIIGEFEGGIGLSALTPICPELGPIIRADSGAPRRGHNHEFIRTPKPNEHRGVRLWLALKAKRKQQKDLPPGTIGHEGGGSQKQLDLLFEIGVLTVER